jgi:hypothetical protein
MNTKTVFIGLGVLIILVLAIVMAQNKSYSPAPSVKINSLSASQEPESSASRTTQEYSDPAGFKFSYPDTVVVSPEKLIRANGYASLTVTSPKNKGKLTIEAVSSDLTTLDNLIRSKVDIREMKLADLEAKQYVEKNSIVTLALDKGVLFTLTVSSGDDADFWSQVNDTIISSFSFVTPIETKSAPDSSVAEDDSSVMLEGEETVE